MDLTVAVAGSPAAATADFVCDGVDDEIEINDAIAAVGAAGGGTVHLAAGAYVTGGPIAAFDNNVAISGAGAALTTITAATGWQETIAPSGAEISGIVTFCGVDNFACSGVAIDGDTNNISCNGIIAVPTGSLGAGQPCTNGVIANNWLFLNQAHTYSIWSLLGEHILIQNNFVDGHSTSSNSSPYQEGIELFGAHDATVVNNIVQNIGNIGINVGGLASVVANSVVDGVLIQGNTVASATSGIHLATTYDPTNGPQDLLNVVIANNSFSNLAALGIWYQTVGGNAATPPTFANIDIHGNTIDMETALGLGPSAFWFDNPTSPGQVDFSNINVHDNSVTIANDTAYVVFLGLDDFTFSNNQITAAAQTLASSESFDGSSYFSATSNTFNGHSLDNSLAGGVGNDQVTAGAGNDWLFGGGGGDTFVFDGGSGHDVIADFQAGDVVKLNGTSFGSFDAVQKALSWTGNGVSLNLGGGDSILIQDQHLFDLSAGNFSFTNVTSGATPTSTDSSAAGHDLQGDFYGNGQDEIIWVDAANQPYMSQISGALTTQVQPFGGPLDQYHIAGTGDFNNDGRSDILFSRDSGEVAEWLMNGSTVSAGYTLGYASSYELIGTGDFDGNGYSDVLFQQKGTGQLALWKFSAGNQFVGQEIGPKLAMTDWKVVGTGDFNGDGRTDILLDNNAGQLGLWSVKADGSISGSYIGGPLGSSWQVVGVGDVNSDHIDDIVLVNSSGQTAAWEMQHDLTFLGAYVGSPVQPSQATLAGVADVNGDGKGDLVFRYVDHSGGGAEAVWLLDGFTPTVQATVATDHHTGWLLA